LLIEAPTTSSSPTSPPETPSAVAARRAAVVKRLSGVDHYCIAGSSAGVNGPDIRLLEVQTQQQQQLNHRSETSADSSGHSDKKTEAKSDTLAPPPSPMYLGLSLLVACATAAGIAARR